MSIRHAFFVALFVLSGSSQAGTQAPPPVPLREYAHPHKLVDVDHGRRLNVVCVGSGSPTVIFEAGGGDDSSSFRFVQPAISLVTRACSYDRAAIGFSDPTTHPADAANVVADLHRLVRAISPGESVVLVGHSDGGLYVPLYAATYPSDVAGMVLIDPFTVGADRVAAALLTPTERKAWYASDDKDIAQAKACVDDARKGSLKKPSSERSPCLDYPPNADPERHAVLNARLARPSEQEALFTALTDTYPPPDRGMSASEKLLFRANPAFGRTPLIVLTAGLSEQTDLPVATQDKISAAWKRNNDELAARSSRGKNIVVTGSHHYIQNDDPGAVIDAVKEIVSIARTDVNSAPAYPPHVLSAAGAAH